MVISLLWEMIFSFYDWFWLLLNLVGFVVFGIIFVLGSGWGVFVFMVWKYNLIYIIKNVVLGWFF